MSYQPGSLIFKEMGVEDPKPLNSGVRIDVPMEIINESREHIGRCFLLDFLQQNFKKERQTAFEIADNRDEKLRSITPTLSRLQSELLGKIIKRSLFIFEQEEFIDEPPTEDGAIFDVVYNSPAARAQLGTKAVEIERFIQSVVPLGQLFGPEFMDDLSPERLLQELTKARSVNGTYFQDRRREGRAAATTAAAASNAGDA